MTRLGEAQALKETRDVSENAVLWRLKATAHRLAA